MLDKNNDFKLNEYDYKLFKWCWFKHHYYLTSIINKKYFFIIEREKKNIFIEEL